MKRGILKKVNVAIISLLVRMRIFLGFIDVCLLYYKLSVPVLCFIGWVWGVYIPVFYSVFPNIRIGILPSTLLFDLQFLYVRVDVFEGRNKVNTFCAQTYHWSYFPPPSCMFKCRKFFWNIWINKSPFLHIKLCSESHITKTK